MRSVGGPGGQVFRSPIHLHSAHPKAAENFRLQSIKSNFSSITAVYVHDGALCAEMTDCVIELAKQNKATRGELRNEPSRLS